MYMEHEQMCSQDDREGVEGDDRKKWTTNSRRLMHVK